MTLEIITRCTRPQNLLTVKDSIFQYTNWDIHYTNWDIHWHIIFDTNAISSLDGEMLHDLQKDHYQEITIYFMRSTPGDMAHSLISKIIDYIDIESYVYILDDDNILHPNFLDRTYELIFDESVKGIIFSQHIGGKDFTGQEIRVAAPENIKVQKIDMAQFILSKEIIDIRFTPGTYVADGMFIEDIFYRRSKDFLVIDEVLCYYNYLEASKSKYFLPRVLMSGTETTELKSNKAAPYESDDLYVVNSDSVFSSIHEHNPDCFVTVGEDFTTSDLCKLPYDFRQRWIHLKSEENIGEIAYQCAMHSILNSDISNLVSIFTPIYNTKEKLHRAYQSLTNQSHNNWEWVLVNDSTDALTGKIARELAKKDPRVKVYEFKEKTRGIIGESKYRAAVLCRGNYLLELDHDDYLLPDALELMLKAFEQYPDAGFCYSDCAEIDENYNSMMYGEGFAMGYGKYRKETHLGKEFDVAIASNFNPLSIRHIVGVPNHFRAWKKDAYFKAGCHNRRLSIADDYELVIRTFLTSKIVKVQRCCYLQFFDGNNTQDATRSDIQRRVRTIAANYSFKIKERFEEYGKEDWAFTDRTPRFGNEENFINYIYTV